MAENRNVGLNVRVLEDKETLMCFDRDPAPIDETTGTFLEGWHSAGLEPADSTWEENREVTSNTTNLTGGQTATSYTAGAVTSTVNLTPGSPVLDYIEWPETIEQDGTLYRKHSSKVAKAYVARVHKFQSGVLGIKVSRERADLTVAARSTANDPAPRAVNIIYKNGETDELMFEERFYVIGEDNTVTQVTPKVFQTVADAQAKIAAGTAFVPKGSAAGLTAMVPVAEDAGDATLHEFMEPEEPEEPENP